MSFALLKPSMGGGEITPSLWGRLDFEKTQVGASVLRNCFVSYRGPAFSRAGTMMAAQMLTPASAASLPPVIRRFQFNISQSYILEFGVDPTGRPYMRVYANGAAITETSQTITGATQANPCVLTVPSHGYSNGDWVYVSGVGGMVQLNSRTFIVANVTTNTFTLQTTFGVPVNSLGYGAFTGGGTAARIFTNYNPLYALADLPYLKVVQSADVMTLTCVNQQTGTEYPPVDLARLAANNWTFTTTTFASDIDAPASCSASATVTGSPATQYAFCVTAVSGDGEESIASPVAYVTDSVDIAVTAGSLVVNWAAVAGASSYNVYMAPPSYDAAVPIGSAFGFIGSSVGNQFVNTNIEPDFTKTPPTHNDPFARGQIVEVGTITQTGTFAQATTVAAIVTSTGSDGVIIPVVVSNVVVAGIVQDSGVAYQNGDTVTFKDATNGGSGSAPLVIGPQSGTYPAVASYFQERRVYANTTNNPDTEYFSQTGAFTNMDASSPPIDSDAIVLTPWGVQVNGIQWLQPMQSGLISMTGLSSWLIAGSSGAGSTLTPSSESALEQESYGFSPIIKPVKINYSIVYVSPLGTAVRSEHFDFYTGGFIGTEISILSNHLFENFQLTQWAWAQEPYKLIWAARNDGKFLSCTYLEEEKLIAWARHDTNGLVAGVETATEAPVDAPYFVVKRYIAGVGQWAYFLERMANRIDWTGPENVWCVDCGLALNQPTPNATLMAAAAEGPGTITGGYIATNGQGYTAPSGEVIDPQGTGSGGSVVLTQTGGAITGLTFVPGQGYSPSTYLKISDPTGAGATVILFVSQNVQFTASNPAGPAAVFAGNQPGDVIRIGGGQAVVSQIISPSQVLAAITVPIKQTIPNDPNMLPVPAAPGDWSITTPVTTITNLDHLEGMQVYGKMDGADIPLTTVVDGSITLPTAASAVIIGLPFIAQAQSLYVESQPTIQGKRKATTGATVRVEKSRGVQVGCNQPVASTLDYQQEVPWADLQDMPDYAMDGQAPASAMPLFTGDKFVPLSASWTNWDGWQAAPGFVCAQQTTPNPMNILAFIPSVELGDPNG